MRITLVCVGRLAAAPEGKLADTYAERASAIGRTLGLGPIEIREIDPRRMGTTAQMRAILASAKGAPLIAWDRTGAALSSTAFAVFLRGLKDQGLPRLTMAIGGAEGLDAATCAGALKTLSMGDLTWPHALARVMVAEQLYRAATILAGAPYHRE